MEKGDISEVISALVDYLENQVNKDYILNENVLYTMGLYLKYYYESLHVV